MTNSMRGQTAIFLMTTIIVGCTTSCAIHKRTVCVDADPYPLSKIRIQEQYTTKVYPFRTVYRGENRSGWILPFLPMRMRELTRQEMRYNGQLVWSRDYPWDFKEEGGCNFYPNHDETAIFVESSYRHEPSFILWPESPHAVSITLPEELKTLAHEYTYPLKYVRWDGLSSIVVMTEGMLGAGKAAYWSVDPTTGATRLRP